MSNRYDQHDRIAGFMWGLLAGGLLVAGMLWEPKLILIAFFPILGAWLFRGRAII